VYGKTYSHICPRICLPQSEAERGGRGASRPPINPLYGSLIATGCHLIACVKCIEKVYLRCNCNCGSATVSGRHHPSPKRPPFDAPGNTLRHRNPFLYARPAIPISVDDFVLLGFVASKKTKNRRQQKHIDNRKTKELKKKREEN